MRAKKTRKTPTTDRRSRLRLESLENREVPATFVVTHTGDFGEGSLRWAITGANTDPDPDRDDIKFAIDPGTPGVVQTIRPETPLPALADSDGVRIDGYTQPGSMPNTKAVGSDAKLRIVIDGTKAGAGADGLRITAGSNEVRGLVINRFDQYGIFVASSSGNVIAGNYIGTDYKGTAPEPNLIGIYVGSDAPETQVGGTNPSDRNVVSGNTNSGMRFYSPRNVVEGNYVGVDAGGKLGLGNGNGVAFAAGGNRLGGFTDAARNVIAANHESLTVVQNVALADTGDVPNVIAGNYIGLAADGDTIPGPQLYGIYVAGHSRNTQILNNTVSGNGGFGIIIHPQAENTTIQGNFIGTDATGTVSRANRGSGVLSAAPGLRIGGPTATPGKGLGNVISGNTEFGLNLGGVGVVVQGNVIGLAADGHSVVGVQPIGINFGGGSNALIGGSSPEERNVISGNFDRGVLLDSRFGDTPAHSNVVVGNYIGTDVTGTDVRPNGTGVALHRGPFKNRIADNLIRGNTLHGVRIQDTGSNDNTVSGNAILDNGNDGVRVENGATFNLIGGPGEEDGNLISGNGRDGVHISEGFLNRVLRNRIGTDAFGLIAVPNGRDGVGLSGGGGNVVGDGAVTGNLISANTGYGVTVASDKNTVVGNRVGTTADGLSALGNGLAGILVTGSGNTIGRANVGVGAFFLDGNLVSGNRSFAGILLHGGRANTVLGNFVGVNALGTAPVANAGEGIWLQDASFNEIGSTVTENAGNLVSGNFRNGIRLGGDSDFNRVVNNSVGTTVFGAGVLPNSGSGVYVAGTSSDNVVGGGVADPDWVAPRVRNVIAFHQRAGVVVAEGAESNAIRFNSIFDNALLGIDLGDDWVTANDGPFDPDAGPNRLQNFPTVWAVDDGLVTVSGTLETHANEAFLVDVYISPSPDPSWFGEGREYLHTVSVSTDAGGVGSFSFIPPRAIPPGWVVTATATRKLTGDTSEFSGASPVYYWYWFDGGAGVAPPVFPKTEDSPAVSARLTPAPVPLPAVTDVLGEDAGAIQGLFAGVDLGEYEPSRSPVAPAFDTAIDPGWPESDGRAL